MRALDVQDEPFASMPDLCGEGDEPSHARITRWLAGLIGHASLVPGDRLPTEGDLAAALGVSRMTLRQALGALESRGLVVRKRGRSGGTFVSRPRIECDLTGLPGFTEQMRRANVRAGARVVAADLVRADPVVAAALDLDRGGAVYQVVRVRSANREPLAIEETYLAERDFPGLTEHRLGGSLYALMRRAYDLVPVSAQEWLEPVVADERQADLLETEPGSALMLVTRTAYTESGRPIEHAYDRYRADRTRIGLQTGIGTLTRKSV
ncbi:MAG TPA: GntR family transcriptional regulator [Nocardioidaceae bacterium]|nr:GntR family transcriptional regulator [Nocardioidaceae bacterium]